MWHSDIGVGYAEQQLAIKGKERKILKSVTINWHLGQMQYVPAVHSGVTIGHMNRTVVTTGKGKINNQPAFCMCTAVTTVVQKTTVVTAEKECKTNNQPVAIARSGIRIGHGKQSK